MYATLIIIMTSLTPGDQTPVVRAVTVPAAQCASLANHPPQKAGWNTRAICAPGDHAPTVRKFP